VKLYLFAAGRAFGVIALKNYLKLDCEIVHLDYRRGDQLTPQYLALNPNKKMPTLEDDGFILWESNAILFYMAAKHSETGLWPADLRGQADVVRWLAWESAHWDAESCGMVSFEKASKAVLGLGPPDPAFIARGEQNFRIRRRSGCLARWQNMADRRAADDRGLLGGRDDPLGRGHGAFLRAFCGDPSLV